MEKVIKDLKIKLFADGADLSTMKDLSKQLFIKGLTTNPTLMRKSGINDYEEFAKEVLDAIPNLPISFEVFSDDEHEMISQAHKISSWGENVYVKIPITNTQGKFSGNVINSLSNNGIKLNVTAIMTLGQVKDTLEVLNENVHNFISIFAGRIADTGRDPVLICKKALEAMKLNPNTELIWASPREVLNIFQAEEIGCHVITATTDILSKLNLIGKDLEEYSLETVQMFRNDALKSGFIL